MEDFMNYTFDGKNYIANDGYIFKNKLNEMTAIIMRLSEYDSIDNYDVIVKPVEQTEEVEVDNYDNGNNV